MCIISKIHSETIACILFLIGLIFHAPAFGQIMSESFESIKVQEQGIALGANGVVGKCVALKEGEVYPRFKFPEVLPGDYSVMLWMKVSRFPDRWHWNDQMPLSVVSLIEKDSNKEWGLLRIDKKKLMYSYHNGSKFDNRTGISELTTDKWVHIALVRQDNQVLLYLNGNAEFQGYLNQKHIWSGMQIGRIENRRELNGFVDEIQVFDVALSQPEIKQIALKQNSRLFMDFAPSSIKITPRWGTYPSLKASGNTVYALQDQLNASVAIVPWTAPDSRDILYHGKMRDWVYGTRVALYSVDGKAVDGIPVYEEGKQIDGLPGADFKVVLRDGNMFDLVASAENSAFSHLKTMIYLKNIGTPGNPKFEPPVPIKLNGDIDFRKHLKNPRLQGTYIKDLDGDGVLDLLVICSVGSQGLAQFPDRASMFNGNEYPNQGKGRGYDVMGNWLGERRHSALYWAKGVRDSDGMLEFSDPKIVHYQHRGFAVQWKEYVGASAVAAMELNGQLQILFAGNKDQIVAMPAHVDNGELYCGEAVSFTENPRMKRIYFPSNITVADIDGDGKEEVVVDGNPGVVLVLKGDKVGEFKEVGLVQMRGGSVRGETLVTPVREDWNGDGYPDLLIGDASGFLSCWDGTQDPRVYENPRLLKSGDEIIHHQAGLSGSIQGASEERWGYLNPNVFDWNGDGLPDVICNDISANIVLYKGTGNPDSLSVPIPFSYQEKSLPVAWRTRPAVVSKAHNVFGMGRHGLVIVDWDGELSIAIPKANGSTEMEKVEKIKDDKGRVIRLSGAGGLWGRAKLTVVDWDEDGKWDLVFASSKTSMRRLMGDKAPPEAGPLWMKNVGTNENPVFGKFTPIKLKEGGYIQLGEHNASVFPTDIDGDGRIDLIIGAEDGKVYYFYRDQLAFNE